MLLLCDHEAVMQQLPCNPYGTWSTSHPLFWKPMCKRSFGCVMVRGLFFTGTCSWVTALFPCLSFIVLFALELKRTTQKLKMLQGSY